MIIKHLGREINTIHYDGKVEYDKVKEIRDGFYSEDWDKANIQLEKLLAGGITSNHIYHYYFERIANDTILHHSKWSINEVLESDELIQMLINKTYANEKVYNRDLVNNFKTSLRLGGKGVAVKPPQFPIKKVAELLQHYLPNGGSYYDPCAGWGARLMGAAKMDNVDYYATDVNVPLVSKLNDLALHISDHQAFKYDIRLSGAEQLQHDWVDKMDLIFTSPPYFDLEDYVHGEQSIKNNNYKQWLSNFVEPMLSNNYSYLKPNSFCLMNVNNFKDYDLVGDFIRVAREVGFEYIGYHVLDNIQRTNSSGGFNDNSEKILIFKKVE